MSFSETKSLFSCAYRAWKKTEFERNIPQYGLEKYLDFTSDMDLGKLQSLLGLFYDGSPRLLSLWLISLVGKWKYYYCIDKLESYYCIDGFSINCTDLKH